MLDDCISAETDADKLLRNLQDEIDHTVWSLYQINSTDRALIERELGSRSPQLVWPQMEGKSVAQKRREHVRRLISHFLTDVLKEKRDGILPLCDGSGQPTSSEEIRRRLARTFGDEMAAKMQPEITKALGRSLEDWLDGPFIKWHTKLYNKRPIIWQISSDDHHHTFNAFIYIHRMDQDTLRKLQTQYLWNVRRSLESRRESALADEDYGRVEDLEAGLHALANFETRLLRVIQGEVDCDIPKWAEGPYRDGIYDPVLDDGVKVNIEPLQAAGLLRYSKMV